MPKKNERYVMVTTAHRGVFAGVLEDRTEKTATLTQARMCVYWSTDMHGVLGLASGGPSRSCRVTPAVERIELNDVTSVVDCSDSAREAWEAEPWG